VHQEPAQEVRPDSAALPVIRHSEREFGFRRCGECVSGFSDDVPWCFTRFSNPGDMAALVNEYQPAEGGPPSGHGTGVSLGRHDQGGQA
jgi:hypothetical protein